MAKERERAEVQSVLNALTGSPDLRVEEVDSQQNIIFRATANITENLQWAFGYATNFATTIWRAVKGDIFLPENQSNITGATDSEQESPESKENDAVYSRLKATATSTIETLISDVNNAGLGEFKEGEYKIATSVTEANSIASAKQMKGTAGMLSLVLQLPQELKGILENTRNSFKIEELKGMRDLEEEVDRNIFSVSRQDRVVTTKFNLTAFLQYIQKACGLYDSNPIIAKVMGEDGTYKLNLNHLKIYIGKKISPLIFEPFNQGDNLKPIAIFPQNKPEDLAKTNCLFSIAIDISHSMNTNGNIDICKNKLKVILEQIDAKTDNYTVDLVAFNNNINHRLFISELGKEQVLSQMYNYVDSLKAEGKTALYDTMYQQFTSLNPENYTHRAIVVFTDGIDNTGEKKIKNVEQIAVEKRDNTPNLQVFTLELGQNNHDFFTSLAKKIGGTHIQLDNMSDLSQFDQYTSQLKLNSHVVKFIQEAKDLYDMIVAVEGDLKVGDLVTQNTRILLEIDGEKYNIAHPTTTLEDLVLVGMSGTEGQEG